MRTPGSQMRGNAVEHEGFGADTEEDFLEGRAGAPAQALGHCFPGLHLAGQQEGPVTEASGATSCPCRRDGRTSSWSGWIYPPGTHEV